MPPNIPQQAAKPPQPSVKVTVTHTAPDVRRAAAGAANAAKTAARAPSASAGQTQQTPAAFNPLGGFLSSAQLGNLAARITKTNTNADLIPLRQQAAQLRNSERTVQGRYAGYTATGDQVMQGLQANAQAGAASQDNLIAQAAQNTANQIDQTGAAAQAANGGYLDPQVAQQIALGRTAAGTQLGGQAGFTAGMGANEANFMSNLRASAAAQGIQGQRDIVSAFAKPIATNAGQQDALIAKENPTARSLAATLGQQQFTDYSTLQGLGLKKQAEQLASTKANQTFTLGQQRNQIAAENAATAAARQQSEAAYQSGSLALGNARLGAQEQNNYANQRIKAIDAKIAQGNLSEKQRHDLTNERIAWQRVSGASTAGMSSSQRKALGNVAGEAAWYSQALAEGMAPQKAQGGVTQALRNDGAEGRAAIEMATQGYISAKTAAALKLQGVNVPNAWLRPLHGVKGSTTSPGPSGQGGVSGKA